jgi:hypothetical protein
MLGSPAIPELSSQVERQTEQPLTALGWAQSKKDESVVPPIQGIQGHGPEGVPQRTGASAGPKQDGGAHLVPESQVAAQ